jgi:hypothetical protein
MEEKIACLTITEATGSGEERVTTEQKFIYEDGKLTASKITFYKEPKDYEIRDFILKKYNQLNFSPAVENVVIEKQKSYKKKTT